MPWLCVWQLWFEAVPPKAFLVLRIPTSARAVAVTVGQGTWRGSTACLSSCLLAARLLDLLPAVHVVDCRINTEIKHGKRKLGLSFLLCKCLQLL